MEASDNAAFRDDARAVYASLRAPLFAFVSAQFLQIPDAGFVSGMLTDEFIGIMEDATGEQAVDGQIREGLNLIAVYLRDAQEKDLGAVLDELGVDRTRLYRGLAANYGPRAPYETLWLYPDYSNNTILQELAEEYRLSGKSFSQDAHDRPDYLGIELRYYTSLIEDEAELTPEDGDGSASEEYRDLRARQQGFLQKHLIRWAPFFIQAALPEARTAFYRGHLIVLQALLDLESELFKKPEDRI